MESAALSVADLNIGPQKGHIYALIILTIINLLNYMDRYIPSATKDLYKEDLKLSDTQTSLPLTAFMIVYMLASPIFGFLADRGVSRKLLIAIGIVLWSLATGAAFFAHNFWQFLLCRTFVGFGEAGYATIAPALLSDFYPPNKRTRALTIFYIAVPVGSAIGFALGSILGSALSWRYAFLICGAPGALVAIFVMFIKDPGVGVFENPNTKKCSLSWWQTLKLLSKNKVFIVATLGNIFLTFAVGALGDWLPTYLKREAHASVIESGTVVGAITVVGGLGGTILGGFLVDKLQKRLSNAFMAVSSIASFFGATFALITILLKSTPFPVIATMILIAQIFLWCYSGPINALQANSVSANIRARAFSVSLMSIHAFGDAISPSIIGAVSDATGSLFSAMFIIPAFIWIASIIWGIGWWRLDAPESSDQDIPQNSADQTPNAKSPLISNAM